MIFDLDDDQVLSKLTFHIIEVTIKKKLELVNFFTEIGYVLINLHVLINSLVQFVQCSVYAHFEKMTHVL